MFIFDDNIVFASQILCLALKGDLTCLLFRTDLYGSAANQTTSSQIDEFIQEDKLYTFMIERGDLQMPAGKLASQAIHASRLSLLKYLNSMPRDQRDEAIRLFIDLNTCGSAIALRAKNLDQLIKARDAAIDAGLPWALFSDSGHILPPHFTGEPIITALAIGPSQRHKIHPITKKFRCVP